MAVADSAGHSGLRNRIAHARAVVSRRSPQALLVAGFAGLILVGTILLMLPCSHVAGKVGFVEALFTSTSAVCVTGLIVVDTARDFTLFGQTVILVLIQLGGLGIMTFAALVIQVMGRRLSLAGQAALHDSFSQRDMASDFRPVFRRVLTTVAAIEFVGMFGLFLSLLSSEGAGRAAWSAVFHAISAFCNAGFSIYSENLVHIHNNAAALAIVMVLIVLGGLGHVVLVELREFVRSPRARSRSGMVGLLPGARMRGFSLHTKVVLVTTVWLILGGAFGLFLLGSGDPGSGLGHRFWTALFQSITARTAGFNTVSIAGLPVASLVLLAFLMFVGGSPASCAGGVKTTTLAIFFARLRSLFSGSQDLVLFRRQVAGDVAERAERVVLLSVTWNLLGVLILAALESDRCGFGLERIVFEQLSAFGTVGLSADVTPLLSTAGRLWIIATMFVGRLGPLTLATWVEKRKAPKVRYPEGRLMIG